MKGRIVRAALVCVSLTMIAFGVFPPPGHASPLTSAQGDLAALEGGVGSQTVSFGVQLQWGQDSPAQYVQRAGRRPTLYGSFVGFPFSSSTTTALNAEISQARQAHGVFMLTLEPMGGLGSVTTSALSDLTRRLTGWNRDGSAVVVRFAHEMNGSWYPWGQRPSQYVRTFRRVATAVHRAPASDILWSPNEGGGYPFDGPYNARPGSADYTALDTDHDGTITMADDPYAPYYPGDAYVDLVGLSLYHFGTSYPWGENEVPDPGKFVGKVTGTYSNAAVDETALPDFYAEFAVGHRKNFVVSETSALYNSGRTDGATNLQIKSAWLDQVFAPDLMDRFPRLRLIDWFEYDKHENDVQNGLVIWSVTRDPELLQAFLSRIPVWLRFPDQAA